MSIKYMVVMILVLASSGLRAQQSVSSRSLGFSAKMSTNGVGADLYWQRFDKWAFKLGYEQLWFNYNHLFEETRFSVNIDSKLNTGSLSLGATYQFLDWLYGTAALGYMTFNINVQGYLTDQIRFGELKLNPDQVGAITVDIKPALPLLPYVALGFGRANPRRKVSFGCEIGTWYMGKPRVGISATGMLSPNADPEHVAVLRRQIKNYRFYPVLKLTLGVKLWEYERQKQ